MQKVELEVVWQGVELTQVLADDIIHHRFPGRAGLVEVPDEFPVTGVGELLACADQPVLVDLLEGEAQRPLL